MDEMNFQQLQMLEVFKQLVDAVERGQTELLDITIKISKEGITSMTVMIKEKDE